MAVREPNPQESTPEVSTVTGSASSWTAPVPVDGAGWFVRHRYVLLSAVVVVLVASQTRNQQWTKDVWLHASVAAELARSPLSPADPLLGGVGAPNEWLSPYGLLTGAVTRMLGLTPLTTLSVFAVVNTVLLLAALWWFVVTVTANRRAPFYALLAVLLVWGPGAWRWSGFVHLDAVGYVASYPSTFALAALLATLTLTVQLLDRSAVRGADRRVTGPTRAPDSSTAPSTTTADRASADTTPPTTAPPTVHDAAPTSRDTAPTRNPATAEGTTPGSTPATEPVTRLLGTAAAIAVGCWLVVLCHPPSTPILVVGLLAVALSRPGRAPGVGHVALAGAVVVAAVGVAVWPFFSLWALDPTGEIVEPMSILYDGPLLRVAPALLGLPFVALRVRERHRDLLGLLLAGVAAVYVVGWATGHDEVGRAIAIVALVLQIALGDGLGRLEARLAGHERLPVAGWAVLAVSAVAAVAGVVSLRAGAVRMVPRQLWPPSVAADARVDSPGDELGVVADVVPDGSTVLAPLDTSKYLPAYGAKVVASPLWAGASATDADARRAAVTSFFAPGATPSARTAVLDRYRPTFVVVDRDIVAPSVEAELAALGLTEVARTDRLVVLRVPAR